MAHKTENNAVFKMVIPAAGKGTRFLPITKAVPKEMLPLGPRPAVAWVMQEAQRVGIQAVGMIISAQKPAVSQYFSPDELLETQLRQKANHSAQARQALAEVENIQQYPAISFIEQSQPLGLGHAVAQACQFVAGQPFAVALPDDIFHPEDPLLERMITVRQILGGSVVALLKVNPEQAQAYGSARITPLDSNQLQQLGMGKDEIFSLSDIIEKPTAAQVRSEYGMVGRYILDPVIFPILAQTSPGIGAEIQLTDALAKAATLPREQGGGVWGVVVKGRRFDIGSPLGYTQAVVQTALEDPSYGPEFASWLKTVVPN